MSRPFEELASVRERVENIRSRAKKPDEASPAAARGEPPIDDALRELSSTLEQLGIAEEELRQQNESLRESRDALEQERERYRSLFNFAPDPYLVTDAYGTILEANQAAAELLGWRQHRLVGKPLPVMVSMEGRRDFRERMAACAQQGRPEVWEMTVGRGEAPPVPVEARVRPLIENDGTVLRWLLRDITERRSAEEALRRSNEELEHRVAERTAELSAANESLVARELERESLVEELRASEARLIAQTRELGRSNDDLRDFAYVASHDLKEPLRGISNFAGFLLDDCGDTIGAAGREKLEVMQRLARRLHDLLDSLLEYSRAGRMELKVEVTPLAEVAQEIVDSLRPWLDEQRAEVRIGALPSVPCDRSRMGEVFSNLVVNAVKYNTSGRPKVELHEEAPPAPGVHRVAVLDNGIGIEPRHAEAVFKMFRRLHPRDRFGGGTGAGLAIVRKVVERHGGRIWVESRAEGGSCFYLDLPYALPEPQAPACRPPEGAPPAGNAKP